MSEVYVVRQFFEDGNDNSYTGAYDNFWKALAGAIADRKEKWGDPGYGFGVNDPIEFNPDPVSRGYLDPVMLWCDVLYQGEPLGIYYTINRMELE